MNLAVIDSRMPPKACEALKKMGYEPCPLPPHPLLDEPVSAHPDMLLFFAPDAVYCTAEYARLAKDFLGRIALQTKRKLRLIDREQRKDYPHDILFNAAAVGKYLFCLSAHTAPEILHTEQYTIAPVKQGYAKCSTLPIGDNALITEDPSIASAASARGLDVLKVTPCAVNLPGYSTGFLGGASSYSPYKTTEEILFCGDLDLHPDAAAIRKFCFKHKRIPVSLGAFPPLDVGTIFLL
ncbi:MAG: hypothetical protein IJW49_06945 [Clostridia bacterium]|nr:hypothetical protein [Clostridia bacterium]